MTLGLFGVLALHCSPFAAAGSAAKATAQPATATGTTPPYYDRWDTFDRRDGLPSDKCLCVAATDAGVWVGTDRGLARFRDGKWTTYTRRDGLAHNAVMGIAQDTGTGDLWIATMGGLSRYSAGRFDTFTQLNSGLTNDLVYGVAVHRGEVWAATASGTSRYQIAADRWFIYNQANTPMHEPWCYAATGAGDRVYLAVWGGGLLEYDLTRNRWKDYRDPDGEMEIDLFRNDGLLHDVVATVTRDDAGRIWLGTYFGLSSYDGRKWRNFMDHDSPLVSNFVNVVQAGQAGCFAQKGTKPFASPVVRGGFAWIGTDNGLNATDRLNWWSYRRDEKTNRGLVTWSPADGNSESFTTETVFPSNYILGIGFRGDDIWLATEKGVARGRLSTPNVGQASQPVIGTTGSKAGPTKGEMKR